MQYIIMLIVVVVLVVADIVTGVIAHVINDKFNYKGARNACLRKSVDLVIMGAACGLEVGLKYLGEYLNMDVLGMVTGIVASSIVFMYIVVTNLISIFEHFAAMNPDTPWAQKVIEKLHLISDGEDSGNKDEEEKAGDSDGGSEEV